MTPLHPTTDSSTAKDLTQPPTALAVTERHYRIDRRQISFLRFILEAYEGVAVVTTLSPREGIVTIRIAPGCEQLVMAILQDLSVRQHILMEPLPGGGHTDLGDP